MTVTLILLVIALVVAVALLAAAAAGTLARIDGATYPAAVMRGAGVFAAVLTLACAVTAAVAAVVR
ncbi:hypothetical protein AB0L75_43710 [Streptomyces sp. NPDC052101]|uniref:hypothetical protein n=1 Tax=Streptomyces sp. NPDC052101 TaxID=3155763 RepID=UPI003412814C